MPIQANQRRISDLREACTQVESEFSGIDIIVADAGIQSAVRNGRRRLT